jgi:hypothetical protein
MTDKPASHDDIEAQLESFIEKFTPEVAALIRDCRAALRARLPAAIELVYDNYNALAIGFGSSERTSDVVVSLACYARGALLYFYYGAALPDPDGLLQGEGTRGRHVRLEGPATISDPGVEALIVAALDFARVPMPQARPGRVVIKSISAKQRPRRPRGETE